MKIRNIGILAHVDAGKTTLTEQLAFTTGALKRVGSVDKGTTLSDTLAVERERGISVHSSVLTLMHEGVKINVIDTPGHADFAGEVERALLALDAAILIISAADGIQAQTVVIWQALREMKIPTLIFINKIDHPAFDQERLVEEVQSELSSTVIPIQCVKNGGSRSAEVIPFWNPLCFDENSLHKEGFIEHVAGLDDALLERYFDSVPLTFEEVDEVFKMWIYKGKAVPLLFGLARDGRGVDQLLKAIIHYFPEPKSTSVDGLLSAVVYKVEHDPQHGKMAWVRLLGGQLKRRDAVALSSSDEPVKVTAIKQMIGGKFVDIEAVNAGDIAAICGLTTAQIGDILGNQGNLPVHATIVHPLLTVQVKPVQTADYAKLAVALQQLNSEDPSLALEWLKDEKEFHVKINGWIQMEVLERLLQEQYEIQAVFETPTVIYKETPATVGFGFDAYTMPKPCWAVIKFRIEPAVQGAGVTYRSEVSTDRVAQRYQQEIERSIDDALKQGVKGWEVTDINIVFVEGEDHVMHSRAGNFKLCTNLALMNGLQEIGTTLLEPILSYKIVAPEALLGKVASDLHQMRATLGKPEIVDDRFILTGEVPLATSLEYSVKLTSRSGGKARITTQFSHYAPVSDEEGVVRDYRGISPLDRAKYILKMRNAIQ